MTLKSRNCSIHPTVPLNEIAIMSAAYRGMPNQVGVPPQYMGTTQMRPMAPVADPGAMHRKRVQNKV